MRSLSVPSIPELAAAALVLAIAGFAGCSGGEQDGAAEKAEQPAKVEQVAFGEYVNAEDSLPRLRYFDGDQLSLNDRCPVRKVRLNPKMPPAYVNGRPVGFC
jgi:hypothetical protein